MNSKIIKKNFINPPKDIFLNIKITKYFCISITKNCINIDKTKKYSISNHVSLFFRRKNMLAKILKKVGLIILIIACLWNVVFKLVSKVSFDDAINSAKAKIQSITNFNK